MSIFGKPQIPDHIAKLKARVSERDTTMATKLELIYTDYDARLSAAEKKLQGDLDGHALDAEAAISELTNRGEQVAAASSGDVKETVAEPEKPFRADTE